MLKLLVSGSYPLVDFVKKEIHKRRDSIPNLTIQEVDSKHILKRPYYITNEDILICGVVLAERLKVLKVRGHIVPLRVQTRDFIRALVSASKVSDQICIVNYYKEFLKEDPHFNEQSFSEMVGIKLKQYVFKSTEDAEVVVKKLSVDPKNVIVGSGLVVKMAKKHGMHSVLWYSEETIQLSVDIAFAILQAKVLERGNHKRQGIIMENFQEGVISLNSMNRVMNMNQAAISVLELDAGANYESQLISEVIGRSELLNELLKQNEVSDNIIKYKQKTLILNKQAIYVNDALDGYVIMLSDVEALQQKENKVRKKLNKNNEGATYIFEDIIGESEPMLKAKMKAKKFAKADANVLILGESGTGKELFAQSIHNASSRASHPFVAVNCAAIPENLLESEFFGYSDGAFTGALKGGKAGLFEVAHNGTIFLDEIGELPLSMQAKLLRVLQEKNVRRVGGAAAIPINVRVVSATNVNLMEGVKAGDFRMDLYYRVAVLNLFLPSLNERQGDIQRLFEHFTIHHSPALYPKISPFFKAALPFLEKHFWEGNVREFENTIERLFAYLIAEDHIDETLFVSYLDEAIQENTYLLTRSSEEESFHQTIKEVEYTKIQDVLARTNGNKQEAAKILGISRSTLWRKINEGMDK